MQREIKFRAWDGKRMYQPAIVNGKDWNLLEDRAIEGYPLMQYTGLKDKNGKDIYEGDIIHVDEKVMEVKFVEGCWRTKYGSYTNYRLYGWVAGSIEIIGNIYEQAEQLS